MASVILSFGELLKVNRSRASNDCFKCISLLKNTKIKIAIKSLIINCPMTCNTLVNQI